MTAWYVRGGEGRTEVRHGKDAGILITHLPLICQIKRSGFPDHIVPNSPECLLKPCPPGHVDQEVAGGVDGEGQVGHHAQPGDQGGGVQPAGGGTPLYDMDYFFNLLVG